MKHSAYGVWFYCFMVFFFFCLLFKSEDTSVQQVLKTDLVSRQPCQISQDFRNTSIFYNAPGKLLIKAWQ